MLNATSKHIGGETNPKKQPINDILITCRLASGEINQNPLLASPSTIPSSFGSNLIVWHRVGQATNRTLCESQLE
jgi:hypothetical protein